MFAEESEFVFCKTCSVLIFYLFIYLFIFHSWGGTPSSAIGCFSGGSTDHNTNKQTLKTLKTQQYTLKQECTVRSINVSTNNNNTTL